VSPNAKQRTKVLVVGPDRSDPGGVANYYNAVLPRLSNSSYEIFYFEIGSTRGGGRIAHVIMDQFRFWRALGKCKPDIVHLNPSLDLKSFLRDGLFVFLTKLRGRLTLVFFRGWQKPFEKHVSGKFNYFFSVTYRRADAFIVLARDFSNRLRQWGVSAPILIGSTTVDDTLLEEFSIREKTDGIQSAGVVRLLFLARLEREKGVLELVTAVNRLLDEGAAISLTIAGDGSVVDDVQDLIDSFGLGDDAVRLVGYVRGDEKVDILRSHHIYCFPTQYGEGMPNSVLEAMAFGMPVMTCPVGGIADFFEDQKMGALVADADPDTIASALHLLLSDRTHLAEISQFNYTYAQQHFLASITAETLRTCYQEMLVT
jgi:glycosyltransferase involved in cell wall biosynthesis